ncbi:MAG: hypothetical protein LC772_08150 [Chloroflexi bacterium]|nr:hypothetical protein [Chloroflexota bacterium]
MHVFRQRRLIPAVYALPVFALCLGVWSVSAEILNSTRPASDGPPFVKAPPAMAKGDPKRGQQVFRFETFGDEGFWTDAARLPQGMKKAHVTLLAALKNGVNIDVDRVDPAVLRRLSREFKTNLSPANAPLLNSPALLAELVKSDAVVGLVTRSGKVGITCALCHTITDASVCSFQGKGSIGHREDGRTPHFLNLGKLLSIAANSRAFFPQLQLQSGGKTIGRALRGLTPNSTEAEVDAYLTNPKYYPVGMFDDTPDGNGNPVHIQPLFRQDLAAPYGSSGQVAHLEDFSNAAYTVLFDPTTLTTPGGRAFLKAEAGAAGLKLADGYVHVLKATGVRGYPYVHATKAGMPGKEATPVGLRVENQKLLDLNAYLASLPAPEGIVRNPAAVARGRQLFRSNCTSCHNEDQSKPVSDILVPMKRIFPGYRPTVIAKRPPLSPVQNSPGTFGDKMIVVDASQRGGIRGDALPLLLDLARKPVFLHDDSVHGLAALFDPRRGAMAPHPFYFRNASQRADMVAFLDSLDTRR